MRGCKMLCDSNRTDQINAIALYRQIMRIALKVRPTELLQFFVHTNLGKIGAKIAMIKLFDPDSHLATTTSNLKNSRAGFKLFDAKRVG